MNAQTKIYWLVVQSIHSLQKMRFIIQVNPSSAIKAVFRTFGTERERKRKGRV